MIEAAALLEELKDFDATPLQDDLKGSFEHCRTAELYAFAITTAKRVIDRKRCSNFPLRRVLEQVENIFQSRYIAVHDGFYGRTSDRVDDDIDVVSFD